TRVPAEQRIVDLRPVPGFGVVPDVVVGEHRDRPRCIRGRGDSTREQQACRGERKRTANARAHASTMSRVRPPNGRRRRRRKPGRPTSSNPAAVAKRTIMTNATSRYETTFSVATWSRVIATG